MTGEVCAQSRDEFAAQPPTPSSRPMVSSDAATAMHTRAVNFLVDRIFNEFSDVLAGSCERARLGREIVSDDRQIVSDVPTSFCEKPEGCGLDCYDHPFPRVR